MRTLTATLCAVSLLFAAPAFAQDKKAPSEAQKAQQQRMKDCNKQAGDKKLKGDERKKFMSECLKGGAAAADQKADKATAQQSKMKSCNKEAGDKKLKGDARKKFMSECLKG